MTVTVTDILAGPFHPNGVTTAFPFDFKVPSADEVRVFSYAGGIETTLDPGLYSVTIAPDTEGGTVTFTLPPAAALDPIFIEADPLFSQAANFNNNGFLPRTLNPNFDRAAIRDLVLRERIGRAIRVPFGEQALDLPTAANRASTVLGFDAEGRPQPISLGDASFVLQAQRREFTATDGQNTFLFLAAPLAGFISVYLNGVRLPSSDYSTGILSVTLATPCAAGDSVVLEGFVSRIIQDAGTTSYGNRTVAAALDDQHNIKKFGAKCDGSTDDTSAWEDALSELSAGDTINFSGFTLISRTLVWSKPINIVGGSREGNGFLVDSAGTYKQTPDGKKCAIWLPHSTTVVPGMSAGIDARHSVLRGFTVKPKTTSPANMRGIVLTVVAHADNVSVDGFSSDGWAVVASNDPLSEPIPNLPLGNANGFTLRTCRGYLNGGRGLFLAGNNANAGEYGNFVAASNTGYGVDDQSFLGNNGSPEVDNNTGGGARTSTLSSCKVTFVGYYSETSPHGLFGPGAMVINAKNVKANAALGGWQLQTIPTGAVATGDLVFSATDDRANDRGDGATPGPALAVGAGGLDYKAQHPGLRVKLNGLLSSNYTTFYNGTFPVASFPNSAFTGNISPNRFHFHDGFTLGGSGKSGIVGAGTAAPTTGTYAQGAIWLNDAPAASGFVGWVCVTGGTPGTWKTFGAISA